MRDTAYGTPSCQAGYLQQRRDMTRRHAKIENKMHPSSAESAYHDFVPGDRQFSIHPMLPGLQLGLNESTVHDPSASLFLALLPSHCDAAKQDLALLQLRPVAC
jgi:hypothetical protein